MRMRLTAVAAAASVGVAVAGSMGGLGAAAAGVVSHPTPGAQHAELTANAHFDPSPAMRTVHAVGTPGTAHPAHRNGRGPNDPYSSQPCANAKSSTATPRNAATPQD